MLTLLARHLQSQTILSPSICCSYWRSKSKFLWWRFYFPEQTVFLWSCRLRTKCDMNKRKSWLCMFFKQRCASFGHFFFLVLLTNWSCKQIKTKDFSQTTDEFFLELTSFYTLKHILRVVQMKLPQGENHDEKLGTSMVCRLKNPKKGVAHEQGWCVASCLVRAVCTLTTSLSSSSHSLQVKPSLTPPLCNEPHH